LLCLQTSEMYVKLNIILVWKLVKIVSEDDFLPIYHGDFGDFWKFMFHMVV